MRYFKHILILIFIVKTFHVSAQSGSKQDRSLSPKNKQEASSKIFSARKSKPKRNANDGLVLTKKSSKSENNDPNKVANHTRKRKSFWISTRDFFCKSCIDSKTDCPDKIDKKNTIPEFTNANVSVARANLIRSTNSVHFDVVQLDDIHLDIPAFKQFKNNMTDFTADGEHEFHDIIGKIGIYLGTNYEGKGVTLKIIGSASQIPTSFDPDKANNNINKDGTSIIGQTSIANNKKLAKARADELAKKIKSVFPSIEIITPHLDDIELGKTAWTKESQAMLNEAFKKKDKKAIQEVYEPYQKDQWVKVESKEKTSKSVQPESIRMYMVSTTPSLKTMLNGEETTIRSVFIISKKTFELISDHKTFNTIEDRDKYLEELDLKIFYQVKNGTTRWYLLHGIDEIRAFKTENYNEKVYNLYQLGIVDNMDEQILEQKIIADLNATRY